MFDKIKSIAFWLGVFAEYFSSNWFYIFLLVSVTAFLWRQSEKPENIVDGKWNKAFWISLTITIALNLYFFYDAYIIKTTQTTTGGSVLKY